MDLLIFGGLCFLGWKLFELLRIPSPAILGSIVAVGAGNLLGLPMAVPFWVRPVLSLSMGTMIGLRFNLKAKGLIKEICLAVGWIIAMSLLASKALQAAGLCETTAVFAATPGGLSEVALMAISFDADILAVTMLQTSRLLITMFIIPLIAAKLPQPSQAPQTEESAPKRQISPRGWLIIAALTCTSAFILNSIGVPAAMIIGPMLAVGIFTQLRGYSVKIPNLLQKTIQAGIGGIVGLGVAGESLRAATGFLLPLLYLNIIIVGGGLLLALVLKKISRWDTLTCLLCASPAGLSPSIMLSIELNADSSKVALFQVLRLFTALLFASVYSLLML